MEGHRRLWNKIAEMIRSGVKDTCAYAYKRGALNLLCEFRYISSNCYCCEYDFQYECNYDHDRCSHCPIIWGSCDEGRCYSSEYREFKIALWVENYDEAAKIAEEIASLPEREGE